MLSDENKLVISANTVGETFLDLGGKNIRVVVGIPVVGKRASLSYTLCHICQ